MTTTATRVLHRVECDPACGFIIQSHVDDEVIETARSHCRSAHGKVLTAADVRGFWKSV